MATLLEKALATPRGPRAHPPAAGTLVEELEVAIAYASGTITGNQARSAFGGSRQNISSRIGGTFSKAWRAGLIQKTPKE